MSYKQAVIAPRNKEEKNINFLFICKKYIYKNNLKNPNDKS
jgi:hypothetical protein